MGLFDMLNEAVAEAGGVVKNLGEAAAGAKSQYLDTKKLFKNDDQGKPILPESNKVAPGSLTTPAQTNTLPIFVIVGAALFLFLVMRKR